MSGKPAARMTDPSLKGGPIMKGSLTVLIGSQGGLACSGCPMGISVGSPVNPLLGAKVLSDETDFSLPGPMPLVWSRNYSSYISPDGGEAAQVGLLGPGWQMPGALSLVLDADRTRLFDGKGRVITFDESLQPGVLLNSQSEGLQLYRPRGADRNTPIFTTGEGGDENNDRFTYPDAQILQEPISSEIAKRLAWLAPYGLHQDPRVVLAWSQGGDVLWVFARHPQGTANRYVLLAIMDRFGRRLLHHYSAHGELSGFTDGAGRVYRIELGVLNAAGQVVRDRKSVV